MLGRANIAEKIKKLYQPNLMAKTPATDEIKLRDSEEREENNAYCVALNSLLHNWLRKATNIAKRTQLYCDTSICAKSLRLWNILTNINMWTRCN